MGRCLVLGNPPAQGGICRLGHRVKRCPLYFFLPSVHTLLLIIPPSHKTTWCPKGLLCGQALSLLFRILHSEWTLKTHGYHTACLPIIT